MARLVSSVVMQSAEHMGSCCFQRGQRVGSRGQCIDLPRLFTQPQGGLLMSGKVEQTSLITGCCSTSGMNAVVKHGAAGKMVLHPHSELHYSTVVSFWVAYLYFWLAFTVLAKTQDISWINILDFNTSYWKSPGKDLTVWWGRKCSLTMCALDCILRI